MTLKEQLATDPAMKTEYDNAIASAKIEAGVEMKAQMSEAFAVATPIMSSDSYTEKVKLRIGVKAAAGDIEGVKDIVAMADMMRESNNQSAAQGEQSAETPPSEPDGKKAEAENDFQARLAQKGRV